MIHHYEYVYAPPKQRRVRPNHPSIMFLHEVLALLPLWRPARCAKSGASDIGLRWTGAGPWYLEPLGLEGEVILIGYDWI